MDCSALPEDAIRQLLARAQRDRDHPGPRPGPQLLLNAHYDSTPTGPGRRRRRPWRRVLLEVGSTPQGRAAAAARDAPVQRGRGIRAQRRRTHSSAADPLARQVNSLINIDVARRQRAGPDVRDQRPEWSGVAALCRCDAPALRQFDQHRFRQAHPQHDRRGYLQAARLDAAQLRHHRQRDPLPLAGRHRCRARPGRASAHVGSEVLAATRAMADIAPRSGRAAAGRMVFTDLAGRRVLPPAPCRCCGRCWRRCCSLALLLAWRQKALGKPLLCAAAHEPSAGSRRRAFVAFVLACFARAISGEPIRSLPTLPSMRCCCWRWPRFTRAGSQVRPRAHARRSLAADPHCGDDPQLRLARRDNFLPDRSGRRARRDRTSARSPTVRLARSRGRVIQFLMFAELLAAGRNAADRRAAVGGCSAGGARGLARDCRVEADAARGPSIAAAARRSLAYGSAALVVPRASAERPLGFSIDYFRDADRNTAIWAHRDQAGAPARPAFPGEWRKGVLPYNGRTRWISTAPLLATPVASARWLPMMPIGAGRRIRHPAFPGRWQRHQHPLPERREVACARTPGGRGADSGEGEPEKALLRCTGRSCDGLVSRRCSATASRSMPSSSRPASAPSARAPAAAARPRNAIPQYSPDQTITLRA